MIDKCLTKAAGELGVEEGSEADAKAIADTNSQTLSNVIFTQRKGKRGYDERQVDYYLAACTAVRSSFRHGSGCSGSSYCANRHAGRRGFLRCAEQGRA